MARNLASCVDGGGGSKKEKGKKEKGKAVMGRDGITYSGKKSDFDLASDLSKAGTSIPKV